jgi:hypothetical protein
MPKITRRTKTVKKDEANKAVESAVAITDEIITDEPIENTVVDEVEEVKPRTFEATDLIDCISNYVGATFVYGEKSKETYEFEAQGVTVGVQYCDLVYMVNSHSSYLFEPFIIVKDDDFVNKYPKLKEFYNSK